MRISFWYRICLILCTKYLLATTNGNGEISYVVTKEISFNAQLFNVHFSSPTCLDGFKISSVDLKKDHLRAKTKCNDDYKRQKVIPVHDNQSQWLQFDEPTVVTDFTFGPVQFGDSELTPLFCSERQQAHCSKRRTILNQDILNQKFLGSNPERFKRSINGTMPTNTVLTVNESPYDVVADIVIPETNVLIIESGVQLHFALSAGLTVKGRLIAQGSKQATIMMSGTTNMTRWKGLFFETVYKRLDVTLVEGRYANEGVVQVFHVDRWYSICSESWNETIANVACRQLGFSQGAAAQSTLQLLSNVTSSFLSYTLHCGGGERNLADCDSFSASTTCKSSPATLQCLGASAETNSSSTVSILEYVNITNAIEGVVVRGSVPLLSYVTVMNSIYCGITINTIYSAAGGNAKFYKCLFVNNKGHGIQLNMSFPTEEKAISFEIDECLMTAGGESGMFVSGHGHLVVRNTAFFGNAQNGFESRMLSGSVDITNSISASNGRYALLFQREPHSANEKFKISVKSSNITGHWANSAVRVNSQSNSDVIFDKVFAWENYDGFVTVGPINNSDISIMNSNFTRNRGEILRFNGIDEQNKISVNNNRFTLNLLSNYTPYQSVVCMRYNDEIPLLTNIDITNNEFYKNTMHRMITVEPMTVTNVGTELSKNVETTIYRNNFKDNLVPESLYMDAVKANISFNNFNNPVSECELKMGPFRQGWRIMATYNFWGSSQNNYITKRICDYNRNNNLMPIEYQPYMESEVNEISQLKPSKVANQEELGGSLKKESFVLARRNKPYVIVDTLQVGIGSTLTVEPGVVLEFDLDRGAYILGQLNAIGTADSPIIFRSSNGQIWSGIVFENGGSPISNLEYCVIDGSQHGIVLKSDRVSLKNCVISQPLLTGITLTDTAGVYINFGMSKILNSQDIGLRITNRRDSIEIRDLIIENTGGNGIDFDNPVMNITIDNVRLSNSRRYAIHVDQTMNSHQSVEVKNCLVTNQRGVGGIFMAGRNYRTVTVSNTIFTNNTVSSLIMRLRCNYSGNYLPVAPPFNLVNNTFDYNTDLVVDIDLMYCTNANISRNNFLRNNYDRRSGVFRLEMEPVEDFGKENFRIILNGNLFDQNLGEFTAYLLAMNIDGFFGTVSENRFLNNENRRSVLILGSPLFIVTDNVFNNKRATYYIEAEYNDNRILNATRNYWGTNNDLEILATIFDGTKISTRGIINFRPYMISDTNGGIIGPGGGTCAQVNNCSGHGECVANNVCRCYPGYVGQDCSQFSCRDQFDCSNNGRCIGPNSCSCFTGWFGPDCRTPSCNAVNNCSGRGQCVSLNECDCFNGFTGTDCSQFAQAACIGNCNGRGVCTSQNICECQQGWTGRNCELADCTNVNSCSGYGVCSGPNRCECFSGYSGANCSQCIGGNCQATRCSVSCLHGFCDPATRTCVCNPGWTGAACGVCINGANPDSSCNAQNSPAIRYILPEIVSTDPNSKIFVYGENFAKNFSCRFGNITVTANVQSARLIECAVPQIPVGQFDLEIMDNRGSRIKLPDNSSMTLYPSCSSASCNTQQSNCFHGSCICFNGFIGKTCDTKSEPLSIDLDQLPTTIVENQPLHVQLHLKNASVPVRWTLAQGPKNMTIDPNTGELIWTHPTGSSRSIRIEVHALTPNGISSVSMEKTVDPTYYPSIDSSFVTVQNTVQFSGTVHSLKNDSGASLVGRPVKIAVYKNGIKIEEFVTETDDRNKFSVNLAPEYGTGGNYSAIAVHPGNESVPNVAPPEMVGNANWSSQALVATPESFVFNYDRSKNSTQIKINLQNLGAMSVRQFEIKLYPNASTAAIETSLESNGAKVTPDFELQPNQNLTAVIDIQNLNDYKGPLIFSIVTASEVTSRVMINVNPTTEGPYLVADPPTLKIISSATEANANYMLKLTNVGQKPASQVKMTFQNETPIFLTAIVNRTSLIDSSALDSLQILPNETIAMIFGVYPRNIPLIGDMNGTINFTYSDGLTYTARYEIKSKTNQTFEAVVTVLGENALSAQQTTSSAQQFGRLDGVRVDLLKQDVGFRQNKFTDSSGQISFSNVLEGYYELDCARVGYENISKIVYFSLNNNKIQIILYQSQQLKVVIKQSDKLDNTLTFETVNESQKVEGGDVLLPMELDLDFYNNSIQKKSLNIHNMGDYSIQMLPLPTYNSMPFIVESTFMDIPNNTVLKTTINIRPNPIWKHSNTTPDCSAFVVHVLYNYTIGDSIIQKRAKLLLKQSKYKNEDVAICLIDEGGIVKTIPVATKQLVACNCRATRETQCRKNYESLKVCAPINFFQSAGLEPVLQILTLMNNCRLTLTNLENSASSVSCALAIPDVCPDERLALKKIVKRQSQRKNILERFYVDNGVLGQLRSLHPLLYEMSVQPAGYEILREFQRWFDLMKQILNIKRLDIPMEPWFQRFKQSIAFDAAGGELITSNQYDTILLSINEPLSTMAQIAKDQGFDIRPDNETISALLIRWNETVKAWQKGQIQADNQEFISYPLLLQFVNVSNYLSTVSAQNQYRSRMDMLDDKIEKIGQLSNITSESFCFESTLFLTAVNVEENKDFTLELTLKNLQRFETDNIYLQLNFVPSAIYQQNINFYQGTPTLSGIAAVDGTRGLSSGQTIHALWTVTAGTNERLHQVYSYRMGVQISFRYLGRTGVTKIYSRQISVEPKPSLKVFYFIQSNVTNATLNDTNPYNVVIAVMNTGYITVKNIELKNPKIKMVDTRDESKSVPYKLQSLLVQDKLYSANLEPKLEGIKSGEFQVIRYSFSSPENAVLKNFDTQIFADGKIISDVEVEHFTVMRFLNSLTLDKSLLPNMLVSSGINGEASFVYNSKTTSLHPVESSQLVGASEGVMIVNGKQYHTMRVQYRKQTPAGNAPSAGVYGHFELPFVLNDTFQLLTANRSNFTIADNVMWIVNQDNRLPLVNFVDSSSPADQILMTYDFIFGEPNKNGPRFRQFQQALILPLDSRAGYSITKLQATDADGDNVTYQLYGGDGNFVIGRNNGEIKLQTDLPLDNTYYCLNARATDNGFPPLTAVAPLKISVAGATTDDNKPCEVFDNLEERTSYNFVDTSSPAEVVTSMQTSPNSFNSTESSSRISFISVSVTNLDIIRSSFGSSGGSLPSTVSNILSTDSSISSSSTPTTTAATTTASTGQTAVDSSSSSTSTSTSSTSTSTSTSTSIDSSTSTSTTTTSTDTSTSTSASTSSDTSTSSSSSASPTASTSSSLFVSNSAAISLENLSTSSPGSISSESNTILSSSSATTLRTSPLPLTVAVNIDTPPPFPPIGQFESTTTSSTTSSTTSPTQLNTLPTAFVTGNNQLLGETSSTTVLLSNEQSSPGTSVLPVTATDVNVSVPATDVSVTIAVSTSMQNNAESQSSNSLEISTTTTSTTAVAISSEATTSSSSPTTIATSQNNESLVIATIPILSNLSVGDVTSPVSVSSEISLATSTLSGITTASEQITSSSSVSINQGQNQTSPSVDQNVDQSAPNRRIGESIPLPTDFPGVNELDDESAVMLACKLRDQKPTWKVICDLGKNNVKNPRNRKLLDLP